MRKFAVAFISLVSLSLAFSGAIQLWFNFQEAKLAAIRVQHELAHSASERIDAFFSEIQNQIGWTTRREWSWIGLEQQQYDFIRLLRQVPAITEVSYLDGSGREQLKTSRLQPDAVNAGTDFSKELRFTQAVERQTWISQPYYKHNSEPYITISTAHSGRGSGVTVAEVNLKLIRHLVTSIRAGKSGFAYVVDAQGRLIAHPDMTLVLSGSHVFDRPQVRAALQAAVSLGPAAATMGHIEQSPSHFVSDGFAGNAALTAFEIIQRLGWVVFVEVPLEEALAPVYRSLAQAIILMAVGLMLALLAAALVARRIATPLSALCESAREIAQGNLSSIPHVRTGDELEELADQFKTMALQVRSREDALRASEERYAAAARGARDGLWDWDLVGNSVYFSERWMQMLGCNDGGQDQTVDYWLERIFPEDRAAVLQAFRDHLGGASEQLRVEYRVKKPDGTVRWMLARGILSTDPAGQPRRLTGSQTDITDLKHALAEVADHRDQLESLVTTRTHEAHRAREYLISAINTAPDGLILLDEQRNVVLANNKALEVIPGLSQDDPRSAALFSAFLFSPGPFGPEYDQQLIRLYEQGAPLSREIEHSPECWVQISARTVPSGGVIFRIADISHYKQAELTLRQALEKELELNAVQRNFVSMTSHQFRTPLAIVDSAAQRLIRSKSASERMEVLRRASQIREAVARMTRLMESTLSLSQMDAGTIKCQPRRSDLKGLIHSVCLLQKELSPHHLYSVELDDFPAVIDCDLVLMDQVVSNLLSNAVKFSREGSTIRVRGWSDEDGPRLSVTDEGIGIPADQISQTFQRFFRARNASGVGGSGIGLNLAKQIVEMHGGYVSVSSAEGAGTTFTVNFPAASFNNGGPKAERDEHVAHLVH